MSLYVYYGAILVKLEIKIPYFLNLKGYEMHRFGFARLKPFANRCSSPALQCWGLLGDEEHYFMFQHSHGER